MTRDAQDGQVGATVHGSLPARFVATILIGVAGAFVSIAMPGILLALAEQGIFSAERAAMFASIELGGMMVSILLIGPLLNGRHRKTVLAVALTAIVAGNIISVFSYHSDFVLLARLVTGMGEGVAVGALGAAATAFVNPDRLFALFMSTNLGLVTAYLLLLPTLIAAGGIGSAFLILACLGFLGLLALPYFPLATAAHGGEAQPSGRIRFPRFSKRAILGLAGCLGLNTGVGMIWPFMGSLGTARAIPIEAISTSLAMGTFGGIVAGLGAALLGLRVGRHLPLAVATFGLVASAIGLTSASIDYSLCAISFVFFWTFATPYFMGTVAAAEDGVRAAILIPAAQLGGLALGPQLSAPIITHLSLPWIVVGGAALCMLSAIAVLIPVRRTSE